MKGYIFESEDGSFLSKDFFWFPHEKAEDAWVHPADELKGILSISKAFEVRPAFYIEADYSPGCTILGEKTRI